MNKKLSTSIWLAAALAAPAYGEVIFNPANQNFDDKAGLSAAYVNSEIEYENEGGGESEIERQILGVAGSMPIEQDVEFVFQAGLVTETEAEGIGEDGDGYIMGGGVRAKLMENKKTTVIAYGLLSYTTEEISGTDAGFGDSSTKYKVESAIMEIHGGAVANYALNNKLSVYGGMELTPYSDGEGDYKTEGQTNNVGIEEPASTKWDLERDGLLTTRLGAQYDVDQLTVRGELAIMGEQSLTIGGGYRF